MLDGWDAGDTRQAAGGRQDSAERIKRALSLFSVISCVSWINSLTEAGNDPRITLSTRKEWGHAESPHTSNAASIVISAFKTLETGHPALALLAALSNAS